jgi:predicted dehydrogenase
MEVYGDSGYIITRDNTNMIVRNKQNEPAQAVQVTSNNIPVYQDPIAYFADVIRGKITVPKNGLYSLENNVIVVRILDAARQSAKTGKTVMLNNPADKGSRR